MNKDIKVIYKRIEDEIKETGFIDLNDRVINTKEDLADISKIFRDPRYETFRIIYMKDNRIVGYESTSTRTPNIVTLFSDIKGTNKEKAEIGMYKVKDRMKRLDADSYYLVHNHPSGNARASNYDIRTTLKFNDKVEGFKGHLIINENTYSWIDIDEYGDPQTEDSLTIDKLKVEEMSKKISDSQLLENIKIKSRDDIVYLMHNIKNSKEYSTAILTDASGLIRIVLDVPNCFLNMSEEQVKGYFKNLSRENGATRVFFATNDREVYLKSLEHAKYGTFKDNLYYENNGDKIILSEANMEDIGDLFDTNTFMKFKEDIEDYEDEIDEEDDERPKTIRILFKEVGFDPKVLVIPNTLKDKQDLVNGLIEVVPFMDDMLLVCNEEGKLMNLPPNCVFDLDYIAGDFFIIGDDYENGDFRSLTDKEIDDAKEELKIRSIYYKGFSDDEEIEEDKGELDHE